MVARVTMVQLRASKATDSGALCMFLMFVLFAILLGPGPDGI